MSKHYRNVQKRTVINAAGKQIKLGGYRPDHRKHDDKSYGVDRSRLGSLPPKVDLRPHMTPVENQGSSNSCTANAMAGAYEYLAKRVKGYANDTSRLFIYYNARALDNAIKQDEGTYLRSCIEVLKQHGACSENTWPFNLDRVFDEPGSDAYDEAANFLIEEAESVDVDLDAMRSCLADGYPFAFGLMLFSSFQKGGAKGLIPMPDPEHEKHDGGHAMLCVGYSDPDQVFIVRNSWGEDWGDRGYCYIPYAYMTHPDLNGDCWTIRRVSEGTDLSQDIAGDNSSLFDDAIAAIVESLQTPGTDLLDGLLADEDFNISYEEELVYTDDRGYLPIDEIEDLDSWYYKDEEDEEDDDTEDSYEEDEEDGDDEEEIEDEEDYEDEEEYEEDEEDYEDEEEIEDEEDYEDEEEYEEDEDGDEEDYEDEEEIEDEEEYEEDEEE
ncbi:C1 family peptidase [Pantanalinema sp. GBBB05]|uniref:C1 family peptidase n=1 Tax=Pantanalinema sp. GBBB05 TaxID=2604139 RepID=UPI001D5CE2CD|nr:C1 family peptidase [Pantanalinema sp. GBBB05]